jgi:hypothetical protein
MLVTINKRGRLAIQQTGEKVGCTTRIRGRSIPCHSHCHWFNIKNGNTVFCDVAPERRPVMEVTSN